MKTIKSSLFMMLSALTLTSAPCHALTIVANLVPIGTTIPGLGGVNFGPCRVPASAFMHPNVAPFNLAVVHGIFNNAAAYWSTIYTGSGTLTIDWGFCDQGFLPGGANAGSLPTSFGGAGGNISRGSIAISVSQDFYMDTSSTTWDEYGGTSRTGVPFSPNVLFKPVEVGRFTNQITTGDVRYQDLYTIVLHEMGHLLGMNSNLTKYNNEKADNDIDVTLPRPISGPSWNVSGAHLTTAWNGTMLNRSLMWNPRPWGMRQWPSQADITSIAQISNWFVGSWGAGGGGLTLPGANWPTN